MKKPVIEDLEDDSLVEKEEKISPKASKVGKVSKKRGRLDYRIIRKSFTIRKFQETYIISLVKKEEQETGRVVNASEILRKIIDDHMENKK